MAADVLYITFDGVLQPLAFSQVVRVVAGLGARGLGYHLLSLERVGDVESAARRAVDDMLRPAGVAWTPLYGASMGSARLAMQTVARVTARAATIVGRERIKLVHARGYHSALVARAIERLLGVPYVFDARGYWIEERTGPGAWFSTPAAYALGKLAEQVLFRGARAVVTLTELQAADVSSGMFGPPPRAVEVIPTCADYGLFSLRDSRPRKPAGGRSVPEETQRRLDGKIVLGVVGSLNATYFVSETLALAKLVVETSPLAHLLVLSGQRLEYEQLLRSIGLPAGAYTLATAEHWDMPEWLQWIDWGILLVPETAANRAKMPTKLAEFFATGVRPAFFGCNSDAARWVGRAGSGTILSGVRGGDLEAAARTIAESPPDAAQLRSARETTAPHFSLSAGVERYARLIESCLARPHGG